METLDKRKLNELDNNFNAVELQSMKAIFL